MLSGSCLCRRFAFEVHGPFRMMTHCHCTYCRKSHGASFATYVAAASADLRWTAGRGEQGCFALSAGMERAFCPTCGAKVPPEARDELLFLPAGLLDGDPGVRPEAHIFTAFKAPWQTLDDGVPAFAGPPPRYPDPKLPTPPRPDGASAGTVAGSCLCGAVAWEQREVPPRMGHCHCSRCRKLRGAAFSTQIFALPKDLRWIRGRDRVRAFRLAGAAYYGNAFCEVCASPVPREVAGAPAVLVPAGALDDDPGVRPMAHLYVGSRAPWYEIRDDLPQHAEMPTS